MSPIGLAEANWRLPPQEVTDAHVEEAFVDQGSTGEKPAQAAQAQGMRLQVVTWPETRGDIVLLPRRWVVERRVAWTTRVRRLARDDERGPGTLAGLHVLAFTVLMLPRLTLLIAPDP